MVRLYRNRKIKKMKTTTKFFMGIDVSKPYFDVALLVVEDHGKQPLRTGRFDNSVNGLKAFDKWLKTNRVPFDESTLLVIENTGIYHRPLWGYCSKKGLPIHIGNAAHLKWSFGLARGKNDKVDAERLCNYAHRHADELKATPTLDPVLLLLKDLMASRSKLLSQVNAIKSYIKELRGINDSDVQRILEQAHRTAIEGLAKSIKALEAQIKKTVSDNMAIKATYDLLVTVPGIGHLTATYIVCCTNNFLNKVNGKQLACYAGVAPFEHSSGISVRGRTKVHKMANKELKKMLHLCALSAIQAYPEFRDYYERKKAEGKHAMVILNAIRNKIILRAVAVVNN